MKKRHSCPPRVHVAILVYHSEFHSIPSQQRLLKSLSSVQATMEVRRLCVLPWNEILKNVCRAHMECM